MACSTELGVAYAGTTPKVMETPDVTAIVLPSVSMREQLGVNMLLLLDTDAASCFTANIETSASEMLAPTARACCTTAVCNADCAAL
jgi:hypothetical protein